MRITRFVTLAALLVALAAPASGSDEPITITKLEGGAVELRFDPLRIPGDRLYELADLLGPYLPVFRELEAPDAPLDDEVTNAEIALGLTQLVVEQIMRVQPPPELEAVAAYVRREAAFYVCVQRAEILYLRGDDHALGVACDDIEPATACLDLVVQAPLTRGAEARQALAGYSWHNCMNDRFRERLGDYPIDEWRAFLGVHGVEEIEHEGC